MQKLLESSIFYRGLSAFFAWVGVMWHRSRIVTWFLSPGRGRALTDSSVFSKLFGNLHRALCFVFEKLRLNRLFEGSIFKQAFVWCLLPAVLAPVLPTMVLLTLIIVGMFSMLVRFGTNRGLRMAYNPVNKYILLFAALYFVSIFTSVTVSGSLYTGLLTIVFILFAVVYDNSVTTRRQAGLTVRLMVLVGAVVAMYGVYQYFFFDPAKAGSWVDVDMFSDITNRVYSTLGNPNVLAEYLILITPFSFACVLDSKTWTKKLLYLILTGIMLACMLFTSSRGGWLGLIFAAAIFIVMLDARFIFVGIVAVALLYFALPDWAVQRFTSIGNLSDSSTSYRVYIWMGTIAMLKDYWLSGIGPGNAAFNLIYPAYSYNTIAAPHAHNLYLQIMCDTGVAGLLVFLMLLFSYFRRTFSAFSRTRDKTSRVFLTAAVSAIGGFLLQSITDYSFYDSSVTLFFWVVIALGSVFARRSDMPGAGTEEGTLWLRY
jgi:putative inorganic carbon (HCO3(-)) transporter